MLGWLYRMIVGKFTSCIHHWDTIKETHMVMHEDAIPHGVRYTLQCRKCGEITTRKSI